jgi:hypothetical protein
MAALQPQLARNCLVRGRFPLSHNLQRQDANYPRSILVPERYNARDIDLPRSSCVKL